MEPEMFNFFPKGIRALVVDDDARLLRSASMLLALLNFKVATCGSPSAALKLLTSGEIKDVDVVLMDAEKVAACGFDFRAIVEPDLRVPVIYFLSPDHEAAGDEADELLRTLRTGTYILKKPLDADDVCSIWRIIAWRKCYLRIKASVGGGGGGGQGGGGSLLPLLAGSPVEEDEEERVHFKVVRGVKNKKRKSRNNPASSVGSSVAGGHPTKKQEQMNVTGIETDQAGHQQAAPKKCLPKKGNKNGGNSSVSLQQSQAMNGQHYQESLSPFVKSVLQTLDMPPYNPKIFAGGGGSSSNAAASAGASNTAVSAPAAPPPAIPAPALHQVLYHQQQQPAGNVFAGVAPPAAATITATAVTAGQPFSGGNKQQVFDSSSLMFGPFPYQGPPPPPPAVVRPDLFAPRPRPRSETWNFQNPLELPAAGDLVTGMATGGAVIAAAAAATDAGEFGNAACSLIQSLNLGAAQDDGDELAAMLAMYMAAPNSGLAGNEAAAMAELYNNYNYNNRYNNSSAGSFVQPHQVLGNGMGDPAMAGLFGGYAAASFVAPNENQLSVGDDLAAMFASDQNEEAVMFPLEALLGVDVSMYDAGLDGELQGGAAAGAAAAGDVAGTSMNGGVQVGDMGNWDMGAADGLGIMDDNFLNSNGDFLFPHDMNNGRE